MINLKKNISKKKWFIEINNMFIKLCKKLVTLLNKNIKKFYNMYLSNL